MNRRKLIQSLALGTAGVAVSGKSFASMKDDEYDTAPLKGNINHSVCSWTYNFLPLDEMCLTVNKLGFSAIDLLAPKDWPVIQKNGIYCSMCYTAGKISLTEGWNDKKNHDWLIKDFTEAIPQVAKAGYKNLICFSGNRRGMDDETGMNNCAEGLKKIMKLAETSKVVIQMELFNSKVDHKDYMCDKSSWGVELCKKIGSEYFKLLYDIYHMQINEGDVIRTIQDHHPYFGHYHTAGVPGRHEIDDTQELYYPAIMRAIIKTGFKGYVAQEFIPTGKTKEEKIKALRYAVRRCDV
ncbi:MAG: TIM barrel protein [Bacteroidetes bacterium]|nr:TIM barrel protein [Bacteroidota bacterium]